MGAFGSGPGAKVSVRRDKRTKLRTPADMPKKIQPYFRRVVQRLGDNGLEHADIDLLAQYATALWIADEAARLLATEAIVETDTAHGSGTEVRKHPAFTIWRNAVATAQQLGQHFGATVASRARLGIQPEEEQLSLAELLFREVVNREQR